MVDVHCHIIPEVDDGARSWEMAAKMCRMAAADGIDHIVATPHANDEFSYNRQSLSQPLDRLRQVAGSSLSFSLGCDFHFSYENVEGALAQPERYVIENTRYLLIEFSDYGIAPSTGDTLFRLITRGLTPIITHPERNPLLQRELEKVVPWIEIGCLVQVTANALTGRWGETARHAADWLLRHEAVHLLATDAHDTKDRPPILSTARDIVAQSYGADVAKALVEDNPRAIVSGKNTELPYLPRPVLKG